MWSGPVRGGHLVFAIRGALAAPDQLCELANLLPDADVAVVDLPTTGEISIDAFAAAYRELLSEVRRPLTIVGASIGGLVAMVLSDLGEVVALDPPLSPPKLWPLHEIVGRKAAQGILTEANQAWWQAILSVNDYSPVLGCLRRRATVLASGVPLEPPRPLAGIPGLLSADDLSTLERHAMIDLQVVPGAGHDILRDAPEAVARAVRRSFALTPQA